MSSLILLKSTGGFLSIAMFLHLLLIRQDLEHPALHFTLSHLTSNGRSTGEHTSDSIPPKPHGTTPQKRIRVELQECQQAIHINCSPGKMRGTIQKTLIHQSQKPSSYHMPDHIWDAFVGLISNSQDSFPLRWYFVSFTRISTEKASHETSKHRLNFLLLVDPRPNASPNHEIYMQKKLSSSPTLHLVRGTFYIFCNKNKDWGMIWYLYLRKLLQIS